MTYVGLFQSSCQTFPKPINTIFTLGSKAKFNILVLRSFSKCLILIKVGHFYYILDIIYLKFQWVTLFAFPVTNDSGFILKLIFFVNEFCCF